MTMEKKENVRVRFAPSPTGYLHVGGLRTALYNYLFAKKTGGKLILRIEDTDRTRYVEGAVESLIDSLRSAGLTWDEGICQESRIKNQELRIAESVNYSGLIEVGDFGPYVQSERLEIYKKYVAELLENKKAYHCFCSTERLEEMRQTQLAQKQAPMYDRHCANLSVEEVQKKIANGESYVIRMLVPREETIEFEDMVRGKVSFATSIIDDQVLLKSDGFPTYHLANVVDDHLMGITHVIRGEEWLPSTPKHILLYRAFAWQIPTFAHLPLLLNPDKTKLSKRQGDVAVEDYLKKGYLKEVLVNFVALLGWNPGAGETQEVFSLQELEQKFELTKVHKAGAVFDLKKLDWLSSQYIKKLSLAELYVYALPFLEQKEFFKIWSREHETRSAEEKANFVKKILQIEKERLSSFAQAGDENKFFFTDIEYEAALLQWKEMSREELVQSLETALACLAKMDDEWFALGAENETKNLNLEKITGAMLAVAEEKYKLPDGKVDRGALLWPLRAALTGVQKSPSPFEVAWVLGKNETLRRIQKALEKIQQM